MYIYIYMYMCGKMRNYLAEDILGKRMLEVLQVTGEYPHQIT